MWNQLSNQGGKALLALLEVIIHVRREIQIPLGQCNGIPVFCSLLMSLLSLSTPSSSQIEGRLMSNQDLQAMRILAFKLLNFEFGK